jgi:hypothetical protein
MKNPFIYKQATDKMAFNYDEIYLKTEYLTKVYYNAKQKADKLLVSKLTVTLTSCWFPSNNRQKSMSVY